MSEKKFTNRLINETSPYLLQHAHNPVDWYPWGQEAFEVAKREDKPIFLSIGYSACHWCHVMEHESFEDEETAKIMNQLFINIKVDKEERPDVDTIYMSAVQMLTGHGGWPMSVFLTHDKKPYYAGTYFPNVRRYNMPSFKEVLASLINYYHQKKDDLEKKTNMILSNLKLMNDYKESDKEISSKLIDKAIDQLENYFDYENGGFGSKPKFPNTFNLDLLLRQYANTKNTEYLNMVELTLKKMCDGGIYDHLGGAFYRYSVDEHWLIPHFEKMLYDNSLLIKILLEVYQITKNDFYKNKAEESLEYVMREMTQLEGGFYSTQDADSEGEEGKFYVWTKDEVTDILGNIEGNIFCDIFDITQTGNFEHGKSNPQVMMSLSEYATKNNLDLEYITETIEKSKKILFNVRDKRVYPAKDTKILTSWNAMMISAFVKGYQVLKNNKYLEIAEKSTDFILNKLSKDGLLLRTYKDNQAKLNAYLEDYAFFINSLIELNQATLDNKFLVEAERLSKVMIEQFWDHENGAFFYTGKDHEELIVRTKEVLDHSIPSGNSIAISVLLKLSRLTDNRDLEKMAEKALKVFSSAFEKYSSGVSSLLCVVDAYLKPPADAVLVGKNIDEVKPFLDKINEAFKPELMVYFLNTEKQDLSLEIHKEKVSLANRPTAYICKDFVCTKPVTDPEDIIF